MICFERWLLDEVDYVQFLDSCHIYYQRLLLNLGRKIRNSLTESLCLRMPGIRTYFATNLIMQKSVTKCSVGISDFFKLHQIYPHVEHASLFLCPLRFNPNLMNILFQQIQENIGLSCIILEFPNNQLKILFYRQSKSYRLVLLQQMQ